MTTTDPEWSALDVAEMQALAIYDRALCPGCNRPLDVCRAEYEAGRAYVAVPHICMPSLARTVQHRIDEWENAEDKQRRGEAPVRAKWSDGRMYVTRPATPDDELDPESR